MDDKVFQSILPFKIQGLVSLILLKKQIAFINALHYLYDSELYKYLSIEGSKIWHLSNHKLYLMLENEKATQILKFPDFV